MKGSKPRNCGQWTEARFSSFIKSALRSATQRWSPKINSIKKARVGYGEYQCEECGKVGPPTLPPLPGKKKRRKNIIADHITPVVDPVIGFVDWNTYIERMFTESDNFQAICLDCHAKKTAEERVVSTERKRREKVERS